MKKLWQLRIPSNKLGCGIPIRGQVFAFIVCILLVFPYSSLAQTAKLTMKLSNVPVQTVFEQIKKQTNQEVIFSNDDLDATRKVSVNIKSGSIEDVVKQALGSNYAVKMSGKNVLIEAVKEKKSSTQQKQAPRKIKGKVSDEAGNTLPGSTVKIVGLSKGVSTNVTGEFEIEVPGGYNKLEISFVGFNSQTVEIGTSNVLNIKLQESAQKLDEVVVTGMQRMDKRMFTGATTKISAKDAKIDGVADISRSLEGRAAGVSVQNVSGSFGSAPKIRVRGATSIFGSSKPLWVVDGVIIEDGVDVTADDLSSGDAKTLISSAIAGLNSDDIESFQVLKDGSATSIYGARAMAGVIVITTKKGKAGVSTINYTGEFSIRMKPNYANYNIMNSQDQMSIYQELAQKGWLNYADVASARESGVYGNMYKLMNTYDSKTGQFALENTPEARAQYLRQAERRNTDWFDVLFSNSVMQTHSVSMSSGTDKAAYYASLSVMNDPGWFKQSSVERYTATFNSNFNIRKNLSLNIISNGSYRKQNAPGTLSRETDVVSGKVKRDFDINPYSYALNTSRTLDSKTFYTRNYAPFNILDELKNNYIELNVADLKFQGELKWKLFGKVELAALGAVKYSSSSQEHNITDFSNQALAYRAMPTTAIRDKNPFLYTDPDNPYALPVTILPNGGIYNRFDYRNVGYDFRGTFNYNDTFKENHVVNLFGGIETNSLDRFNTWFRGWGRQYSMGDVPFYAYKVFKRGQEEGSPYFSTEPYKIRSAAYFSTLTYSYAGKYTINGTARYEGTNKLGKTRKSRWLPTWNVSGRWNVSDEDFFKYLNPIVSNMTIRASYSLTADRGPAFVTNSSYVLKSEVLWRPSAGVQEPGLSIDDLENSELTYEKKHELNVGLDLGLFNGRVNIGSDYYTRKNFDLIGVVTAQGLGGQVKKYGNSAEMKSSGVELSVSTKNIVTKDFTWTTDFVYSHMENEVTKLQSSKRVIDMVTGNGFAAKGYPVRSIFSIPFKGLNEDGIPTFLDQTGKITTTGIYFQERENVGFLKYSGSADPTDVGSLGNAFTYKNITLNAFITYSFGNVIRLDPVFSSEYSDLNSMPKEFKNRWMVPGDEKYTNVPVIASARQVFMNNQLSYAYNAYNFSDARIADGGFVRMKEISLTYSFDKELIRKFNLSNLALKLQATNLFLLYADKKLNGQDPEFFNTGGVAAPMPKQFTLTLRVGF